MTPPTSMSADTTSRPTDTALDRLHLLFDPGFIGHRRPPPVQQLVHHGPLPHRVA